MSDSPQTTTRPEVRDPAQRARRDRRLTAIIGVAFVAGATASVLWALGPGHRHPAAKPAGHAPPAATANAGHRVAFEPYRRPDPTLPAVPAGHVKRFRIDALMHVTK